MQAGRSSLKKVGTFGNVSNLTTEHHDEERLKVTMTLGRLRYTRGHGDAASAANEGWTSAVNALLTSRSTELAENVLRLSSGIPNLADPGGSERRELGDGRLAKRSQDQQCDG